MIHEFEDHEVVLRWRPAFRMCVNELKSRAEVLQWYIEINSGGVAHTKDEIAKVAQLLEKENGHAKA